MIGRGKFAGLVALVVLACAGGVAAAHQVAAPVPRTTVRSAAVAGGSEPSGDTGRAASQQPQTQAWLARGRQPLAGDFADLGETALSDLHALTLGNGGVLAALAPGYRYVWPRDASFAAVALAVAGHEDDAIQTLRYLQAVQGADGGFQARYLPDGSGPPDGRVEQEDGPGWALWAVESVLSAAPTDQRPAIARSLDELVDRSLLRLSRGTASYGALPAASSDYWERRESRLTLGVAAPTLIGLTAGARLVATAHPVWAARASLQATRLRESIESLWGPDYPRYAGGAGPDTAVAFTQSPYLEVPLAGAVAAAQAAPRRLRQPAGGVSPGATWRRPGGISWTPETALLMLAAAEDGDTASATATLRWLTAHRAADGSLPEKVSAGGQPSSVAPLAWTDALVLLTMDRLDLLTPRVG